LKSPRGITVDQSGRLLVADKENNQILCLHGDGSFFFQMGSEGTGAGQFSEPRDVAVDPENQRILVADSCNHRIQVFSFEGDYLFELGTKGRENGQLCLPFGVACDQAGNIYVADSFNHRIQVFDRKGNFLKKFGSEGSAPGHLKWPCGLAVLSNGNIVVSESWYNDNNKGNKRLSVFDSQGHHLRCIGQDKLKFPGWLSVDPFDNILVADKGIPSLLLFSKEGKLIREIGSEFFSTVWGLTQNQKGQLFVSGSVYGSPDKLFVL